MFFNKKLGGKQLNNKLKKTCFIDDSKLKNDSTLSQKNIEDRSVLSSLSSSCSVKYQSQLKLFKNINNSLSSSSVSSEDSLTTTSKLSSSNMSSITMNSKCSNQNKVSLFKLINLIDLSYI